MSQVLDILDWIYRINKIKATLFFIVNYREPNVLYRNNGNSNHWIIIKTVGTTSNRAGIGARIKVVTGGISQIREVDGGPGFCSQDSLWVHFGLGNHETIDIIERG